MSNEQELLGAILGLVTKPDMVKKNVELLQQNMAAHEKALGAAKASYAAAEQRHQEAAKRESAVALKEKEAANNAIVLEGQRKNLEANLAKLATSSAAFENEKLKHARALKDFDEVRKAHDVDLDRQKSEVQARLAEVGRQKAALDVREAAVAAREEEASKTSLALKDKLQKLKQLAD